MSTYYGFPPNGAGNNNQYQVYPQQPQQPQYDWTNCSFGTWFCYEMVLTDCTTRDILDEVLEDNLLRRAVWEAALIMIVESEPEKSFRNGTKIFKGKFDSISIQRQVEYVIKEAPEYRLAHAIGKLNPSSYDISNAVTSILNGISRNGDRYSLEITMELPRTYYSPAEQDEPVQPYQPWTTDNTGAVWISNPNQNSGNWIGGTVSNCSCITA